MALLLRCSVSLAQKPKSAGHGVLAKACMRSSSQIFTRFSLTDLDISTGVQENVVALDIAVDDVLIMQVFQPLACLCKAIC